MPGTPPGVEVRLSGIRVVITRAFPTGKALAKPGVPTAETSLGGNSRRDRPRRARSLGRGSSPGALVEAGSSLNPSLSRVCA